MAKSNEMRKAKKKKLYTQANCSISAVPFGICIFRSKKKKKQNREEKKKSAHENRHNRRDATLQISTNFFFFLNGISHFTFDALQAVANAPQTHALVCD